MEHARIFLAIALSFLVFMVWGYFFGEQNPAQKIEETAKPEISEPVKPVTDSEKNTALTTPAIQEKNLPEYTPAKDITVTTNLYRMRISPKGAVVKSLILNDYREKAEKGSPLKDLILDGSKTGTLLVSFGDSSLPQIQEALFQTTAKSENIQINTHSETISFSWISPFGYTIEKQYTFRPDSYLIDLQIVLKNTSDNILNNQFSLYLSNLVKPTDAQYGFEGSSALINNALLQIPFKEIPEKAVNAGNINWISLEERYFISSIVPDKPSQAQMKLKFVDNLFQAQLVEPEISIQPGHQAAFNYHVYMGPKSLTVLKSLNLELDKAINFGMFDILAKPCLWLMNSFYSVIPNYGVAIIILTLLVKAVLWPLGTKSYKSMADMKRMQPLLNEIRAKYPNDKKKMNEEVMALYKTYKINPMGGCLPMLVQIPVFFALYRMLYEAIELRHAPFIGWINDLSAPDRLFHFPFSIPFMEPPYGIPVLTLIMGVTMFLQQKMSPPVGDPTQAKMMMLMPVVFTVIFINFSSGLVLYWLVNNVVSILQQYFIQKKYS
ncbi:MAG: membrane protein insertase YidC [Desulfatirhabdiaceae bacterium]